MAEKKMRMVVFCPALGGRTCPFNCPDGDHCLKERQHAMTLTPVTYVGLAAMRDEAGLVHKDAWKRGLAWALERLDEADRVMRDALAHVQNSKLGGNGAVKERMEHVIQTIGKKPDERHRHHPQCPAYRGQSPCRCDANYAYAKLNPE